MCVCIERERCIHIRICRYIHYVEETSEGLLCFSFSPRVEVDLDVRETHLKNCLATICMYIVCMYVYIYIYI